MYMFPNGLTADYEQHVLLHGATSFADVQETCRRLDLAARNSQHTRPSALASVQRYRVSSPRLMPTTNPRDPRPGPGPSRERSRFSVRIVPLFADAHRPLPDLMIPAPVPNRGEHTRASRLGGRVSTVANPATLQMTSDGRGTRYTSTSPATPPPQPRKAPMAPHADMAVVIEGVYGTAADEPVARKTRSGQHCD